MSQLMEAASSGGKVERVVVFGFLTLKMRVCVCVCVCVRERERERESIGVFERKHWSS